MQQNSIQKQQLIPNNVKYYLFLTEVINVVVVVIVATAAFRRQQQLGEQLGSTNSQAAKGC